MSKSKNNPLTAGLTGKLGRTLVFRYVNGETIVAAAPRRGSGKPTARQQVQRSKFRMATVYANGQLSDPVTLALYQEAAVRKQYKSARTLAIADYFNAPVIALVDTFSYTGTIGSKIVVHADDELEVISLSVDIVNADGVVVEKGRAVRRNKSTVWEYVVTVEHAPMAGSKLVVRATDRPGNVGLKEVVI